MIQPLRTVHRLASTVLAIVLPTVLFVGLAARRSLPHADQRVSYSGVLHPIRHSDQVWAKHRIRSSLLRGSSDPTAVQVVFDPPDELSAPDLLVYWSSQLSGGDALPDHALLVGAFANGKPVPLPSTNGQGFLILYSLAHQTIVDTAAMESLR